MTVVICGDVEFDLTSITLGGFHCYRTNELVNSAIKKKLFNIVT